MNRVHRVWMPVALGMSIVLIVTAGCYRPVMTPAEPTVAAEQDASDLSDEDVVATAGAEATQGALTAVAATQAAEGSDEPSDDAPTQEPPPEETAEPVAEPTEAPEPTAVPTVAEEQPTATSEPTAVPETTTGGTVHVVRANETTYSISRLYGVSVADIVAANDLDDATRIYVGQELKIPGTGTQPPATSGGETTYTVKRGDNLYRIALAFGLTYQQLAAYNGISDPDDIYAGQVLRIPPR
jgi:LysM repeat protein